MDRHLVAGEQPESLGFQHGHPWRRGPSLATKGSPIPSDWPVCRLGMARGLLVLTGQWLGGLHLKLPCWYHLQTDG